MADGPGKYNDACTVAMAMTDAQAVVLIVLNGKDGHGFSVVEHEVQTHGKRTAAQLPSILRSVADEIETDVAVDG